MNWFFSDGFWGDCIFGVVFRRLLWWVCFFNLRFFGNKDGDSLLLFFFNFGEWGDSCINFDGWFWFKKELFDCWVKMGEFWGEEKILLYEYWWGIGNGFELECDDKLIFF